ncbi:IclR family transcriptional regulator [Streptomyces sp. NPDC058284]|uniref:IclR family transcriptional regulator n=1 Tax=unclassified Streptomyces TaxID=2593676 RepID=UPI003653BC1D
MKRGRAPTHESSTDIPAGRGVLEGAFLLLDELARTGDAGLTDLAAGAGLPKATAHRLLDQLAAVGAVERASGRYHMGAALARLARSWGASHPLGRAAVQPLRRLSAATGAAVALAAPVGGSMVVVSGMPGPGDEAFPHMPGMVLPPGNAAEAVMSAYRPVTALPPERSPGEWARRLRKVREHGVDLHHCEDEEPASCLVAPVHAPSGGVVGAIGVRFPGHRLPSANMVDATRRAARMLSANLARQPRAREL